MSDLLHRGFHALPHAYRPGAVAIVGVGEELAKAMSGRDPLDMAGDAVETAIADAGLTPDQIDGLMLQPRLPYQFTAEAYHARFGTSHDIWVSHQGGAMTWAGTAPAVAAQAISAGKARNVVNVFGVGWASQRKAGTGGPGEYHEREWAKGAFEVPFGYYPQPVYFAMAARRHMIEFGTSEAQLGAIAVAMRAHANRHPGAQMHGKSLTLDAYLARPLMVDPFRKEDFCLLSDGAAAYVMTSAERAADLRQPMILVQGVAEGAADSGLYFSQQADFTATPQVCSAPTAFAMAGITAADIDVLALYDPFTIVALMMLEDMGFCDKGSGGAFVEGNRLSHARGRAAGGIPLNTHGGMLSHSYLLGMNHIVELVRQLRGEACNQVGGARVAVYGGFTGAEASTLVMVRP